MNSVALKEIDEEIIPKIKPGNVKINSEGFCYREFFVRLPADVTWTAIHETPEVWRLVQENLHTSLRVHDRVCLISHDESELGFGIVSVATGKKVQLAGFRKHTFAGRDTTASWADDLYRVFWDGTGWAIERKTDGVRMRPGSFSTVELAKAEVRKLYPVKIGSK